MSKPFFNSKVTPEIAASSNPPKLETPKVRMYNPLTESVGRLEEQNSAALRSLAEINHLVGELVELNHMENKKMDQLAKTQDVLIEGQHAAEEKRETQDEAVEARQETALEQIKQLMARVQIGTEEVKGLKDVISSEKLGERLEKLEALLQALESNQEKETETVLESNSVQNLLLEEIARKQAEMEKGQRKGFKGLLEKLNIVKGENEKSHDTQLENQKLMVDSLYKLVNEEQVMQEIKRVLND